jgi:light-regulated signal transduction histidine kinase (bacteriophytochrome)
MLARVVAASERMSTIIDSLLSLAKLNRIEPRGDRVDVTALATRVCEQLATSDPARDVRWSVERGIVAQGDPRLIETVLENLLSNAWKFTRDRRPAHVEVVTERAGAETVYVVRDDGAGFRMEAVEKLFRPFQRLHSTAEFEGTGVGLATVARIVRRHGGRIWADGREDGGATFRFTLARP